MVNRERLTIYVHTEGAAQATAGGSRVAFQLRAMGFGINHFSSKILRELTRLGRGEKGKTG